MNSTSLIIAISVAVLLSAVLAFLFWKMRKEEIRLQKLQEISSKDSISPLQLRLQAYERLVLLADRIALHHLIQRLGTPDISAREMQKLLVQTIRQEFEHNLTQQIYVGPEVWSALMNYKDQNIMIINKISSFLPEESTALDLNKSLLDLLSQQTGTPLHQVVSEALGYEARQLMQNGMR